MFSKTPIQISSTQIIPVICQAQAYQMLTIRDGSSGASNIEQKFLAADNVILKVVGIFDSNIPYTINALTALTFNVLPNAVFSIYIYPKEDA